MLTYREQWITINKFPISAAFTAFINNYINVHFNRGNTLPIIKETEVMASELVSF